MVLLVNKETSKHTRLMNFIIANVLTEKREDIAYCLKDCIQLHDDVLDVIIKSINDV